MEGARWFRLAGLLVFALALVASYVYAWGRGASLRCAGLRVCVVDSAELGFLTPDRVSGHLRAGMGSVEGTLLSSVDTHRMESLLGDLASLGRAEVYADCRGYLNVLVSQRRPLFRVMGRSGGSCYVDEGGRAFPLDGAYAAHTLVVSGRIEAPLVGIQLSDSARGSTERLWWQLYELARFIDARSEWRSLIAQVYVASPRRVELVPRVGGFIINLGRLEDVPYKFDKLRSIYRASLPGEGLGAYSVVDLSYSNQVVCVRRGER